MKYISVEKKIPRFMICGTGSGCGKTSVTLAIMGALKKKGLKVQPYKCGCDYIDPMFHEFVTGNKSCNLDSYFCDENTLKNIMCRSFGKSDIAVIEGVMGYYDGISNTSYASSYHISKILKIPSILVVNAKGMSRSLIAMIKGYCELEKDNTIRGVIINNIKDGMYNFYKNLIENELPETEVLGYIPNMPEISLQSRHLGLKTAEETENLAVVTEILSEKALQTINLERIIEISENTENICCEISEIQKGTLFNLSIAKDKAFCFYYNENIEVLEKMGANITYFSPLEDEKIPENSDGIYLGGGYPELYTEKLSSNLKMLESLRNMKSLGIPIMAECGGFMYLHKSIKDMNGSSFKMAGIIDGQAFFTKKLVNFGYVEITSECNGICADKGDTIKAHEFHYSDSTCNGENFIIKRPNGKIRKGIHMQDNIFAGYPHIYFWSNIKYAEKFSESCRRFSLRRKNIC